MGLKEIRAQRHLTLEQVALFAQCDPATISRWERGITQPSVDLVIRLSQALKVRPRDLGVSPNSLEPEPFGPDS